MKEVALAHGILENGHLCACERVCTGSALTLVMKGDCCLNCTSGSCSKLPRESPSDSFLNTHGGHMIQHFETILFVIDSLIYV